MYIVQWRDHEGSPQERRFQRLREVEAEGYLKEFEERDAISI